VREVSVTTPIFGLIDTPADTGGESSTVTLVDVELVVALLASVTIAVQVTVSIALINDGSNCHVVPVCVAPPLEAHV
jgi:hypothetical protein